MTSIEAALRAVVDDLDALDCHYALVGGLAVSVHAEPRLTRDVDVVIAVEGDEAAEATIRDLGGRGYTTVVVTVHEPTGRLSTARLAHPEHDPALVDVLFASSGIEDVVARGAKRVTVTSGLAAPVASIGHLLAMLARDDRNRPNDADDLRRLAEVASESDWGIARAAVDLISERGFHRGRDLAGLMGELRSQA